MEPNVTANSLLFVRRAGFRRNKPKRFDVVLFQEPGKDGLSAIKRVVGLPNEEVFLRNGQLIINGKPVPDLFAFYSEKASDNHKWWTRDDEYIVLGDNRVSALDSRKFGAVKRSTFRGHVRLSLIHI